MCHASHAKKVNGAKIGFSSYFLIEIRPGHVSVRISQEGPVM